MVPRWLLRQRRVAQDRQELCAFCIDFSSFFLGGCSTTYASTVNSGLEGPSVAATGPDSRSDHLQPECGQLTTLQQFLLGQQPLIERFHPLQTLLDRDHILPWQADLLFSIVLLDSGVPQGHLNPRRRSRTGFSSDRQNGEASEESDVATGPIPAVV